MYVSTKKALIDLNIVCKSLINITIITIYDFQHNFYVLAQYSLRDTFYASCFEINVNVRLKMSFKLLLKKKVKESPPGLLSTDGEILRCEACNKQIAYNTTHGSTTLSTRLKSAKHKVKEANGSWKTTTQRSIQDALNSRAVIDKKNLIVISVNGLLPQISP